MNTDKNSSALLGLLFVIPLLLLSFGCQPKDEGTVSDSGQDTLSSDYNVSGSSVEIQGFDFSEARIRFEAPNPNGNTLDMSVRPLMSGDQAVGAVLYLPIEIPAFYNMGPTTMEAVTEAPAEGYIPEVTLNTGYVYCIKTSEEKFAKIQVVNLEYGSRGDGTIYAWFRFDWAFQQDGSRDLGSIIIGQ